jgi:hypothetical protein
MGKGNENIRWERAPAEDECDGEYRMTRTPTNGQDVRLMVLVKDFVGLRVHYAGRTIPCFTSGCEECGKHKPKRWRGYLLATLAGTREKVCFEFPAIAGKRLDNFFKEYGTLKGLILCFSRPSGKANGKVHVSEEGVAKDAHLIGRQPSITDVLERIWGVGDFVKPVEGGMVCQPVSEAELHADGQGRSPKAHRNRIPTESLLRTPNDPAFVVSTEKLTKAIQKIASADGDSIARVNGSPFTQI